MNSMTSSGELRARLQLHATPHIGPQRFQALLKHFGSAVNALTNRNQWPQLGINLPRPDTRQSHKLEQQVEAAMRWSEQPGNHIVLHDCHAYPALLSETHGAPALLFVRGNLAALDSVQLAIVGSRNCSPANKKTASSFAATMAQAGCTITSGMASGIDTAAHHGALRAAGLTIAVVGTGLEKTYPASNHQLQEQIVHNNGCLVSEYMLDEGPLAANFPRRNRIISGLALGVLVVEAGTASGSLISARYAMEQNREVFAIPGSIHYPGSRGCHQLIREGATLVETVDDIMEQWQHWLLPPPANLTSSAPVPQCPILQLLQQGPANNDQLSQQLHIGIPELMQQLTTLEISGSIYSKAGLWHYLAP